MSMHLNWLYVSSIDDNDVKTVIVSLLQLASHRWLFKKCIPKTAKKSVFFQKSVAGVSTVMYIVLLIDVLMFETCCSTQPNVKSHWLRKAVR